MTAIRTILPALLVAVGGLSCGCSAGRGEIEADRRDKGLVLILTGIQGNSPINGHIQQGLRGAGVVCAIEIRQWGSLLPLAKLAVNQMNVMGNRMAARKIADEIAGYQEAFPNRPVYLVGHSGGGGIAVFALEAMAKMAGTRPVSGVVLLSASLSRDYDLTLALRQSRDGLVNFYNEKDVALLGLGTTLLGNMDGGRRPSAGRTGFAPPGPKATAETLDAYKKLYHVRITRDMVDDTASPHVAATSVPFVAAYVAEWVLDKGWPPPRRLSAQAREQQRGPSR